MKQRVDKTVIERLEEVANTPFKRISYTEAVDLLLKAVKEGKKFEFEVSRGGTFQARALLDAVSPAASAVHGKAVVWHHCAGFRAGSECCCSHELDKPPATLMHDETRKVMGPAGVVGSRSGQRARALPYRGGVQRPRHRVQLPQGHQGLLHAAER